MTIRLLVGCILFCLLVSNEASGEELVCVSNYGSARLPNAQNCPDGYDSLADIIKAAEGGNVKAQYKMGVMYTKGIGVSQNLTEATKWYNKSADQGNADAELALKKINQAQPLPTSSSTSSPSKQGQGTQDKSDIQILIRAAEQGDVTAQFKLGGASKNYIDAANWYRKAAEQGHTKAQYYLALLYAGGYGVTQNSAEAAKWYLKAAEQGDPGAQYCIGYRYEKGLGVPKNITEATKWYSKAADQGNVDSKLALEKINQTQSLPASSSTSLPSSKQDQGTQNNSDIQTLRSSEENNNYMKKAENCSRVMDQCFERATIYHARMPEDTPDQFEKKFRMVKEIGNYCRGIIKKCEASNIDNPTLDDFWER